MKIHSVSLGCPKNRVDAEVMLGSLGPSRITLVSEPEEADLVVINTCGFIQPAVEESISVILDAAARVATAGKTGQRPVLAVTGCLVSRYGAELQKELPEVDLFLSTREVDQFADRVRPLLGLAESAPAGPGAGA